MSAVVQLKPDENNVESQADQWFALYIETGDAIAAVDKVYNCTNNASRASMSYKLKKRYASQILDATRSQIEKYAPLAIQTLASLAASSEQDSVKATAAKALAAMAGMDVKVTRDITDDRTDEQLMQALAALVDSDDEMRDKLAAIVNKQG